MSKLPIRTPDQRYVDLFLADDQLLDHLAQIEREQGAAELRRSLRRWTWRLRLQAWWGDGNPIADLCIVVLTVGIAWMVWAR